MSNEYKDWLEDQKIEDAETLKKYPFLEARDGSGKKLGVVMDLEIPNGWMKLFYSLCDKVVEIVEEYGLEDYYFVQVKEKFNELRIYPSDWGKENPAFDKLAELYCHYERLSQYTCVICGGNAAWVNTTGYFFSVCDTDKAFYDATGRIYKWKKLPPFDFS